MFWGKPKVEKPPMEPRNAQPEAPKCPQAPAKEELARDAMGTAETKFTAQEAKREQPEAGLKEIAEFGAAEEKRETIREKRRAERYSMLGKVHNYFSQKIEGLMGEKNARLANDVLGFVPGYDGVRHVLDAEVLRQETLANKNLSWGEKAVGLGKAMLIDLCGKAEIAVDVVTQGGASVAKKGAMKLVEKVELSLGKHIVEHTADSLVEMGNNPKVQDTDPKTAAFMQSAGKWSKETDTTHPKVTKWLGGKIDALKARFMPKRPVPAAAGA